MSPIQPPTIPVVAAVVRRGDRYLVCRRAFGKRHGGLWEFPGGKVHDGETLGEAIRRELREELGMAALDVAAEPRFSAPDPASSFVIFFLDTETRGEPVAHEHEAVGWYGVGDLAQLPLAPSDLRFVREDLLRSG
jgi:mutator protein MutT